MVSSDKHENICLQDELDELQITQEGAKLLENTSKRLLIIHLLNSSSNIVYPRWVQSDKLGHRKDFKEKQDARRSQKTKKQKQKFDYKKKKNMHEEVQIANKHKDSEKEVLWWNL